MIIDVVDAEKENFQHMITVPSLFGIPPSMDSQGKDLLHIYDQLEEMRLNGILSSSPSSPPQSSDGQNELELEQSQMSFLSSNERIEVKPVNGELILKATTLDWMKVGNDDSRFILLCQSDYSNCFVAIQKKALPQSSKRTSSQSLSYTWDNGFSSNTTAHSSQRMASLILENPSLSLQRQQEQEHVPSQIWEYTATFQFLDQKSNTKSNKPSERPSVSGTVWEKGAKAPIILAIGSALEAVLKTAEGFIRHNFPTESIQLLPKSASWRSIEASYSQIQLLQRIGGSLYVSDELLPSSLSRGQANFFFNQLQLKKKTRSSIKRLLVDDPSESMSDQCDLRLVQQSQFEWLRWAKKGFILPISIKKFNYLEVTENVLGFFDAWFIKGKSRYLIPLDPSKSVLTRLPNQKTGVLQETIDPGSSETHRKRPTKTTIDLPQQHGPFALLNEEYNQQQDGEKDGEILFTSEDLLAFSGFSQNLPSSSCSKESLAVWQQRHPDLLSILPPQQEIIPAQLEISQQHGSHADVHQGPPSASLIGSKDSEDGKRMSGRKSSDYLATLRKVRRDKESPQRKMIATSIAKEFSSREENLMAAFRAAEKAAFELFNPDELNLRKRDAVWKLHRASPRQLGLLEKLNIPYNAEQITKGEASSLIQKALSKQ